VALATPLPTTSTRNTAGPEMVIESALADRGAAKQHARAATQIRRGIQPFPFSQLRCPTTRLVYEAPNGR
jgi:hypothetical protein